MFNEWDNNKEITLEDFIAAIEKNGYKKVKESYLLLEADNTFGACAIGQAGINLGLDYASLDNAVSRISENLRNMIVNLNDKTDLSLPEIAYAVRQRYSKQFLKRKFRVSVSDYGHLFKTKP